MSAKHNFDRAHLLAFGQDRLTYGGAYRQYRGLQ